MACVSQWAGLRWWWELLVRWSLMNPWFAGGAVAQVQWSNGGRCSGPGEEVRIGRGGRAAWGWGPLSGGGVCTGGEVGREVAGGRSWLGRGAGRGKEGGGGPRHGVPQQPPFPYTTAPPKKNRSRDRERRDVPLFRHTSAEACPVLLRPSAWSEEARERPRSPRKRRQMSLRSSP